MTLSVVIPTLDGGSLFAQVLAGLAAQRCAVPWELVVVDSHSTDATPDRARQAGARVVSIERSEFNHGLTRNLGIEQARGEIVVLMTQDAVPADEHLLENLLRPFDDPLVAGAFARQVPRPGHDVLIRQRLRAWSAGQDRPRLSQITDRAAYDRLPPLEKMTFCAFDNVCSALRRSAWRQFPFADCRFGEDLDWAKRVLEGGWKIAYEPAACVVHSHDRSARHEYLRTYECHRLLYRLFGAECIPTRRAACLCFMRQAWRDLCTVWRDEPVLSRRLALSARVPGLARASVLGQFRGAREERLARRQAGDGKSREARA